MHDQIHRSLMHVRCRQRWQRVLQAAVYGLLASCSAGVVVGLSRLIAGHPPELLFAIVVLPAGPIVGSVVVGWRGCGWSRAAAAIDRHYDLKDRVATTLEFLRTPDRSVLHDLQVHDTAEHLQRVAPASIVPMRLPRASRYTVPTLMLALVLLLWPPRLRLAVIIPELKLSVASAVESSEDEDQNPDDQAGENRDGGQQPDGQQPGDQDQPTPSQDGGEAGETLAANSELEKEGGDEASGQDGSNGNPQSQSANSVPQSGGTHETTGQDSKHDDGKAAQPEQHPSDAVVEAAGNGTETTRKSGSGEPSESVAELSDGGGSQKTGAPDSGSQQSDQSIPKPAPTGSPDQQSQTKSPTSQGRKYANQKPLTENAEPTKSWGDELVQSFEHERSLAEREHRDQSTPRSDAADSTSEADLLGEPTQLKSDREIHRISGRVADDSTLRSQKSPSLEQIPKARRDYRELYHEYKKQSDAVLKSEEMPLGHRQLIRRYFELIRPTEIDE